MEIEDLVKEKKFIFIVGAPRSGTTWLQTILASHSQVASLNAELRLFSRYVKPLLASWDFEKYNLDKGNWRQGHPLIWSEVDFNTFINDFINRTYLKVLQVKPGATHILDKHPGYSYAIDEIKRIIPQAKFIHMIRDGRDVVPSMISAKKRLGFGQGNVFGATKEWKECVELCRAGQDKYPEDFLEIKYEDLRQDGVSFLPSIFDFCELTYDDASIQLLIDQNSYNNKTVSRPDVKMEKLRTEGKVVWKENLSLYQRFTIEKEGGDLLRELNYVDKKDWWSLSEKEKQRIKTLNFKKRVKEKLKLWIDKL